MQQTISSNSFFRYLTPPPSFPPSVLPINFPATPVNFQSRLIKKIESCPWNAINDIFFITLTIIYSFAFIFTLSLLNFFSLLIFISIDLSLFIRRGVHTNSQHSRILLSETDSSYVILHCPIAPTPAIRARDTLLRTDPAHRVVSVRGNADPAGG